MLIQQAIHGMRAATLFITWGYQPGCHVYDVALGRFVVSAWHGVKDRMSAVVCCRQAQCEMPAVVAMIVDLGADTPTAVGGAKAIQWVEV